MSVQVVLSRIDDDLKVDGDKAAYPEEACVNTVEGTKWLVR